MERAITQLENGTIQVRQVGVPAEFFQGFDLKENEVRMLRFIWIELNRLWVDIKSHQVFGQSFGQEPISVLKKQLRWLRDHGAWSSNVGLLKSGNWLQTNQEWKELRQLTQWMESALSVSMNFSKVIKSFDPELSLEKHREYYLFILELQGAQSELNWNSLSYNKLEVRAQHLVQQVHLLRSVLALLQNLQERIGSVPCPKNLNEGWRFFHFVDTLKGTALRIRQARHLSLMQDSAKLRIEVWRDRARPLIEGRVKLSRIFKSLEAMTDTRLEFLAENLSQKGLLVQFKEFFKNAHNEFDALLQDNMKGEGETWSGVEKAEKLRQWAQWLRAKQGYLESSEAQGLLGSNFKGIDTDFQLALEVNQWAKQMRSDILSSGAFLNESDRNVGDLYGRSLLEFCFSSKAEDWDALLLMSQEPQFLAASQAVDAISQNEWLSFAEALEIYESQGRNVQRWLSQVHLLQVEGEVGLADWMSLKQSYDDFNLIDRQMRSLPVFEKLQQMGVTLTADGLEQIKGLEGFLSKVFYSPLGQGIQRWILGASPVARLAEIRQKAESLIPQLRRVEHQIDLFLKLKEPARVLVEGQELDLRLFQETPILELLGSLQHFLKIKND